MHKRLLMLFACLVLCVSATLTAFVGKFTECGAASNTTINQDKQHLAELQEKYNKIKNNIKTLEQNKAQIDANTQTLLGEKMILEQEYTLLNDQLNAISAIVTEYEGILEKTAQEQSAKEAELDIQLNEFGTLLVELYKNGNDSKFDIFLQSDSYSSYISYVEYMEHILKSSDNMIADINKTIDTIEERKQEYADATEKLKEKEAELATTKTDIEAKSKEIDDKLGADREKLEFTDKEKEQMKKEEQELLKEIQDMQQQIKDKLNASYDGQFSWPFSSNVGFYISSRFGSRSNPFNGSYEYHNGLDIVCARGTAIHAVDAGVVTYAGYRGAFGNVVFIEHGGGLTTIYAHCDSLLVSAGTKVLKDQTIARVGDTGQVTGVHLHFAVSKNGSYVDPEKYLPTYFTRG